VKQIEISDATHRELEMLAAGWHTTVADALARLAAAVTAGGVVHHALRPTLPAPVAVHSLYAGIRTEATFEPDTHLVTMCSGPLCGQTYTSPSGARRAVVAMHNPFVSPVGNGWDFWTVTTTGATLRTLRGAHGDAGGDR